MLNKIWPCIIVLIYILGCDTGVARFDPASTDEILEVAQWYQLIPAMRSKIELEMSGGLQNGEYEDIKKDIEAYIRFNGEDILFNDPDNKPISREPLSCPKCGAVLEVSNERLQTVPSVYR